MARSDWQTDSFSGLRSPKVPHLVDCDTCGGAGTLIAGAHAHNPSSPEVDCGDCGGDGRVRCADDGCCDYDPPGDE